MRSAGTPGFSTGPHGRSTRNTWNGSPQRELTTNTLSGKLGADQGTDAHAARGASEIIEETDTRVRDATGGYPKVRAPASIYWTVSQSQAEPTSAGSTHTAILIHPGAARRTH